MFLETMDLLARGLMKNRNSKRLYPPSYSFLIDSSFETIECCIEYDIPLYRRVSRCIPQQGALLSGPL